MPRPTPAGAYRNSGQALGGTVTTQVVFDTVDTASYPYTSLASGIITLRQPGWVTVNVLVSITGGTTVTPTLKLNGSQVASGSAANAATIAYRYFARAGDTLEVWETDGGFGGQSAVTGPTNTYLHVDPEGVPSTTNQAVNRASLH